MLLALVKALGGGGKQEEVHGEGQEAVQPLTLPLLPSSNGVNLKGRDEMSASFSFSLLPRQG